MNLEASLAKTISFIEEAARAAAHEAPSLLASMASGLSRLARYCPDATGTISRLKKCCRVRQLAWLFGKDRDFKSDCA